MTINLQQAKKLHELGVRKKPLKYWGVMDEDYRGKPRITDAWTDTGIYDHIYPAYSAEELLKMNRSTMIITIYDDGTTIAIQSDKNDENQYLEIESGTTLTEALCNKLIHDLENGIVSLDEVNE